MRDPSDSAQISPALVERCGRIPTATWSDALDRLGIEGVLPGLVQRAGRLPVAGRIVTVVEEVGPLGSARPEEFGIDHILEHAESGDLVIIAQAGEPPASALGGLAALAAQRHGVVGIVVDGAVRDVDELAEVGLPVLSQTVTPASGRGRVAITGVNVPVLIGGVEVRPRDLAVADTTGVVVLPAALLDELLALAEERSRADAEQAAALR